jgi:hypothetical protein
MPDCLRWRDRDVNGVYFPVPECRTEAGERTVDSRRECRVHPIKFLSIFTVLCLWLLYIKRAYMYASCLHALSALPSASIIQNLALLNPGAVAALFSEPWEGVLVKLLDFLEETQPLLIPFFGRRGAVVLYYRLVNAAMADTDAYIDGGHPNSIVSLERAIDQLGWGNRTCDAGEIGRMYLRSNLLSICRLDGDKEETNLIWTGRPILFGRARSKGSVKIRLLLDLRCLS